MVQCQRIESCGFNVLPQARVDSGLSKFDEILMSRYQVNICGPSGALYYGFLCIVSPALFIGKLNTGIYIQLINKHGECVLGIWRLGQTGEAPAEHWLSRCTKTFSESPVSTRIDGKALLRTHYLTNKTMWKQR